MDPESRLVDSYTAPKTLDQIAFILEGLPGDLSLPTLQLDYLELTGQPELRLEIYRLAFWPKSCIGLTNLFDTRQSWLYKPSLRLEGCEFRPQILDRMPQRYHDNALAVAHRQTLFRASSLDHILRLFDIMGTIGRDNIEAVQLEWLATFDENFTGIIEEEDEKALQVFGLLATCKRLRYLDVKLNTYAFVQAYLAHPKRRITSLAPPLRLIEHLQWHTPVVFPDGKTQSCSRASRGSEVMLPGTGLILKNIAFRNFAHALTPELAACDPVLTKLRELRGITWLFVGEMDKFPGQGALMKQWWMDEMTKKNDDVE